MYSGSPKKHRDARAATVFTSDDENAKEFRVRVLVGDANTRSGGVSEVEASTIHTCVNERIEWSGRS